MAVVSLTKLKPELARLRGRQKGTGKLKNLYAIMLYVYTAFFAGEVWMMRRFSINDATFMFLDKGEKLDKQHSLPCNFLPDQRYVLWPNGDGWDVRYLAFEEKRREWLPISESHFADESEAWQSAYDHWMKRRGKLYITQQDRDVAHSELPFYHLNINNVF
ncbi:TPA: hypothetical protein ACGQST_003018 [Enterobacter kobei]